MSNVCIQETASPYSISILESSQTVFDDKMRYVVFVLLIDYRTIDKLKNLIISVLCPFSYRIETEIIFK